MLSALELSTAVRELAGSGAQRAENNLNFHILFCEAPYPRVHVVHPASAGQRFHLFAISESPIAPSCALLDLSVCASRLNTSKFPCSSVRQIWEET
jgi:hypothetical protein